MSKDENRKKEITEVAKHLFFLLGYEKTTIGAIIAKMGVSKGMFYHHYKSKEAVLDDVLSEVADTITKEVVDILTNKSRNAKEKIEDLFTYKRKTINQMCANAPSKVFWMEVYGDISKRCLNIINPYFIKLIYEGVEEGHFKVRNAKYTALIFTSLFVSTGSMQREFLELFDDVEENFAASRDVTSRILGCDFDE